jgi:hypothetical protein
VPVPADHLIGEPGEGFVLAQQRLGGGRIHHAMRWLGQAQRSLDIMCERAVSRTSHGKLLAQHQMVQDDVALSHTRFGPIGDGPDELHESVFARTLLKGYTPVEGWPTEHLPSRRPAAEAKRADLRERAGVA